MEKNLESEFQGASIRLYLVLFIQTFRLLYLVFLFFWKAQQTSIGWM